MWIDTHTHFDFPQFEGTRKDDWEKARHLGVIGQFVMSVSPHNFEAVANVSKQFAGVYFALGIHPMFADKFDSRSATVELKLAIERHIDSPRFIGIGEIGLDGSIGNSDWQKQVDCFVAQLKLARQYDLPVFMHIRKAQDKILKYCRQYAIKCGIAHAFNGSIQQAENYLSQGFKLGFGGAFTYERAKNLRRLVSVLPIEAFVLETDSPDMPPAWAYRQTNYSWHLPRIATEFAQLRGMTEEQLSEQILRNIATLEIALVSV